MAVTHEINWPTLAGLGFTALTLGCGMVGLYTASVAKGAVVEQRLGDTEKTVDRLTTKVDLARQEGVKADIRLDATAIRIEDIQKRVEGALDRMASAIESLRSDRRRASLEMK